MLRQILRGSNPLPSDVGELFVNGVLCRPDDRWRAAAISSPQLVIMLGKDCALRMGPRGFTRPEELGQNSGMKKEILQRDPDRGLLIKDSSCFHGSDLVSHVLRELIEDGGVRIVSRHR